VSTTIAKKIKALLGFQGTSDSDLLTLLNHVHDSMASNPAYPSPPVAMADFKTAIDSYATWIFDAEDGGKKSVSAMKKQRGVVIKLVTLLGHYVESACDDDLATFNSSGLTAASSTKTPPQPLTQSVIKYVDRGANTGQIVVKPDTQKGAVSYEVRYATVPAAGATPTWASIVQTSPKGFTVTGLTAGTAYEFQVRALGRLGYADWSEPVTFICA
jgi:hypothetical protein